MICNAGSVTVQASTIPQRVAVNSNQEVAEMELYADIIIDISHSKLDQTFQYRIPTQLQGHLEPGSVVGIPFGRGNRMTRGYVLRITEHPSCPPEKIKEVQKLETDLAGGESRLVSLALWMRDYYGSTTIQALRTVIPFRQKASEKKKKRIRLLLSRTEAQEKLDFYRQKNQKARARLLEALIEETILPQEIVTGSLKITSAVWKPLEEQGVLRLEEEQVYRTPALLEQLREREEKAKTTAADSPPGHIETADGRQTHTEADGQQWHTETVSSSVGFRLTQEQQVIIDTVRSEWEPKKASKYLIHGITGSGKTAVYMELIADVLARGGQAILLIPEISLTYQNVIRFYRRFGDRISILHSRLSPAERYDQFERAKSGAIDVMIGPRSALFTPFSRLGMIIIDEEHEASYQSESAPRYDARETAWKRARLEGACLVLGSATPSVESYFEAKTGSSRLFEIKHRTAGGILPLVHTVDLRQELKDGNRSILSRLLYEKIAGTLEKKQQCMLFLNRRGYSGFVSCRACGHVMKCPHCDVSLSLHRNGRLICHYCGYETAAVKKCPECGSSYIGGFKAGTQQVEEMIRIAFPQARTLRMDADTTRGKDGHAEILRAFGDHEADILIGTQMIVKGHDFPDVTLVGILAADLSLHISDFQAAERTFQLLTQAAGRAGRGKEPGEVVIQTYDPEHYAIVSAARQDYESFYEQELVFRQLAGYPPAGDMMAVHLACSDQKQLETAADYLSRFARQAAAKYQASVIGPADEAIARINDVYRKALYIKHSEPSRLTAIKNIMEQYIEINTGFQEIKINFERR